MLSAPGDEATLVLEQPVVNTKTTTRGKAMAWAVGQRTTSLAALAKAPKTTDELEELGG
jgi:hypothetical protein